MEGVGLGSARREWVRVRVRREGLMEIKPNPNLNPNPRVKTEPNLDPNLNLNQNPNPNSNPNPNPNLNPNTHPQPQPSLQWEVSWRSVGTEAACNQNIIINLISNGRSHGDLWRRRLPRQPLPRRMLMPRYSTLVRVRVRGC